jgi:hypothetical protein
MLQTGSTNIAEDNDALAPTSLVSLPAERSNSFSSTSTMSPERSVHPCFHHASDHYPTQYRFVFAYPAIRNWNDLFTVLDLIQHSYLQQCTIENLPMELKQSIGYGVGFFMVLISCHVSGADFGAIPNRECILDCNAEYYKQAKKLIRTDAFNAIRDQYGCFGNSVDDLFNTFTRIGELYKDFSIRCTVNCLWFYDMRLCKVVLDGGPPGAGTSGPLPYIPLPCEMHNFLRMYLDAFKTTV